MFGAAEVSFSQKQSDTAVVNRFISREAEAAEAVEYKGARKILRGDVNGDGRADMVVLYTLEGFGGGNSYIQYLAVFLNQGRSFRYATHTGIGGKNLRSVELKSIRAGKINLDTLEYLPADGSCCPSKKVKTSFIFRKAGLKEL